MEAFFNFFDGQALAFLGSAIAVAMCCPHRMMPLVDSSGRLATMFTEEAATRPWAMADSRPRGAGGPHGVHRPDGVPKGGAGGQAGGH